MAYQFDTPVVINIQADAVDITDVHFSDNTGEAVIAYLLGEVQADQSIIWSQPLILRLNQETLLLAMASINGSIAGQDVPDFYVAIQSVAYEAIKERHGITGGTLIQ